MAGGNPNPSPSTRFSKDRQPENKRRPDPLLAALKGKMTDARAAKIAERMLTDAEGGNMQAVAMIWDRMAGKVPNRNENGDPGDFDADLSDVDTKTLKAALKRVV